MTATPSSAGQPTPRMTFVVVLLVAVFAAAIIDVVIPISILDIAETFNVLPGTVAQLSSLIAIVSVITALLLAVFGARFRYKSLLMIGLLFIAFCALGLFFCSIISASSACCSPKRDRVSNDSCDGSNVYR